MSLYTKFNKFSNLSYQEMILLLDGLFYSFLIILVLKTSSTKYLFKIIKSKKHLNFSDSNSFLQKIKLVKRTVNRIALISPSSYTCLIKSLTIKYLLYKNGIQSKLVLGVLRNNGQILDAHAYININNEISILQQHNFIDIFVIE